MPASRVVWERSPAKCSLADRGETAKAGKDDAEAKGGRVLAEEADHQHHDSGKHGQLSQGKVAPWRRRSFFVPRLDDPLSLNGRKPSG